MQKTMTRAHDDPLGRLFQLQIRSNAFHSMNIQRYGFTMAVVKNKMYSIGGMDGSNFLSSVEQTQSGASTWQFVSSMSTARFSHSSAVIGDSIFVTGGHKGVAFLNSVEELDTSTGSWSPIAAMNAKRWHHGSIVLDGRLVVFGGYDQRFNLLCSIETYESEPGNQWNLEPFAMPECTSEFGWALV